MNSSCVDLICLDPPFNSKANYAAPIGSPAEGAGFKDVWALDDIKAHWIDEIQSNNPEIFKVIQAAHRDSNKAYMAYMAPRLMQMHRILKETGSLFLHCDPTMSHYLKILLDAIFGEGNFRNEIIWCYPPGGRAPKYGFHRKHDVILYYSKGEKPVFNHQVTELTEAARKKFSKIDEDGRRYKEFPGGRRTYLDDISGRPVPCWWDDIPSLGQAMGREAVGYPTQKPLALYSRIIKAGSNEGDLVLDPFCGCATTLVAADGLGRKWVGIDMSEKAAELVVRRIKQDQGMFEKIIHRKDLPKRTDQGSIPRYNHPENKNKLYGQQGGQCTGCKVHFLKRNLTFDHIIPVDDGGGDEIENLQLLCGACNSLKSNRGMEYLRKVLELEPIWH